MATLTHAGSPASGFAADGFVIEGHQAANGSVGLRARNPNATLLSTGRGKVAYYVEGPPYTRGWLLGSLSPNETETMYVNGRRGCM